MEAVKKTVMYFEHTQQACQFNF